MCKPEGAQFAELAEGADGICKATVDVIAPSEVRLESNRERSRRRHDRDVVANGRRISRVLVACGLVYFLGRLAGRLRQTTRRLLTRFGERVLEAGV